ncbi:MAG: hypothetical protein ACI9GB_002471, partial [Halioglobus sp.]
APLLSMLIKLGLPLESMALFRKRKAAFLSRLAVSRKSTVLPCLSTARERYFHWPLILIYVSSSRQRWPDRFLFFRNAFSMRGRSRRAIAEWRCDQLHSHVLASNLPGHDSSANRHVPPHALQNDFLLVMSALKADHLSSCN